MTPKQKVKLNALIKNLTAAAVSEAAQDWAGSTTDLGQTARRLALLKAKEKLKLFVESLAEKPLEIE